MFSFDFKILSVDNDVERGSYNIAIATVKTKVIMTTAIIMSVVVIMTIIVNEMIISKM